MKNVRMQITWLAAAAITATVMLAALPALAQEPPAKPQKKVDPSTALQITCGNVTFWTRKDGEKWVIIKVEGMAPGDSKPITIIDGEMYLNSRKCDAALPALAQEEPPSLVGTAWQCGPDYIQITF